MGNFSELDMYLFGHGVHYEIYNKLGAHKYTKDNKDGVIFDLWAPHAKEVFLIGEFNNWDEKSCEMERIAPVQMGIYEIFVPEAREGQLYRYLIITENGEKIYKSDPYASWGELRPGTASRISFIDKFKWTDEKWLQKRIDNKETLYEQPLSIYELHP